MIVRLFFLTFLATTCFGVEKLTLSVSIQDNHQAADIISFVGAEGTVISVIPSGSATGAVTFSLGNIPAMVMDPGTGQWISQAETKWQPGESDPRHFAVRTAEPGQFLVSPKVTGPAILEPRRPLLLHAYPSDIVALIEAPLTGSAWWSRWVEGLGCLLLILLAWPLLKTSRVVATCFVGLISASVIVGFFASLGHWTPGTHLGLHSPQLVPPPALPVMCGVLLAQCPVRRYWSPLLLAGLAAAMGASGGYRSVLETLLLVIATWSLARLLLRAWNRYPMLVQGSWGHPVHGAMWLLVLSVSMRWAFIMSGTLTLSPDEAQYWDWSRRLDWSYHSKPPLIAYINAGLTQVFGDHAGVLRSGAMALQLLCLGGMYMSARTLGASNKALALLVCLGATLPVFTFGGMFMTTDLPMLAAWSWWLYAVIRARKAPDRALRWWALAGMMFAVGFLGKYAMVYALVALITYAITTPGSRRLLWSPGFGLMVGIGLTGTIPVIIWNIQNNWIGLDHVADLAGQKGVSFGPGGLIFAASQLGFASPAIVAMLVLPWRRAFKTRGTAHSPERWWWFLLCASFPILGILFLKGFTQNINANWGVAAYPALIILAVLVWDRVPGSVVTWRWRIGGSVGFGAAATILAFLPVLWSNPLWTVPAKIDPRRQVTGWDQLGHIAGRHLATMPSDTPAFLLTPSYKIAESLTFYTPGKPHPVCINLGRRISQYDLWETVEGREGHNAVLIEHGGLNPVLQQVLDQDFERFDPPEIIELTRDGQVYHRMVLVRCFGFKGTLMGGMVPTGPGGAMRAFGFKGRQIAGAIESR